MDWIMFSIGVGIPFLVIVWGVYRFYYPLEIEPDELGGYDIAAAEEKRRIEAALWGTGNGEEKEGACNQGLDKPCSSACSPLIVVRRREGGRER